MTPLPLPAEIPINMHRKVYSPIPGENAGTIAANVYMAKTPIKINRGLNLSPNHQPNRRDNVATEIKPAVLRSASTLSKENSDTRKLGKYTVKATKEPNVMK